MVAIVSGNSLGLNQGSLARLGDLFPNGPATQARNGEAAYVNVSSGNLVLQDLDSVLMGRGGSDVLSLRTYNSQGGLELVTGDSWRVGQYKSIALVGFDLVRTEGDGSTATYTWNADFQVYVESTSTGEAVDTIDRNLLDGTYTWTSGSTRATESYSVLTGLIETATDSDNNTTTFLYDEFQRLKTVTSADGESVNYTYTLLDLTQISTSLADGRTVSKVDYHYDTPLRRLDRVTVSLDPDSNLPEGSEALVNYVTAYTYDGISDRVATITQSDGSQMSFTYVLVNGSYRVESVTDGDGNTTSYAYNTSARTTTITDPYGVSSVYTYDPKGQLLSIKYGVTPSNTSGLSNVSFSYNALGELVSYMGTTDSAVMTYDAMGNLLSKRIGGQAQNNESWTYSASNQVLTHLVYATGSTDVPTRYVYSASRSTQLRFVVSAEGDVTEYRYNAVGQRTQVLSYTANTYDTSALALTEVPSEAALVTWSSAQDPARLQREDLGYDFRGQLQTSKRYTGSDVGPADSTTQYIYDHRGLLLQTITPDSNTVTQSIYDGLGRVVSQTIRSADSTQSQTTLTQYDDANGKTTVKLQNGLSTTSSYDRTNQLIAVTQSSAGAVLGTTSYAYDADNRLLMSTDATGKRMWMIYDAAGRKVADIDATGQLTEYVYSASGDFGGLVAGSIAYNTLVNTAQLTDASGAPTTAYAGNPAAAPSGATVVTLAGIRPQATATDAKTWNYYQTNGLLINRVDALGYATELRYDGAFQLISTTQYATAVATSNLPMGGSNMIGYQTYPTSAADRTASTIYDRDERVRATIDAEGYITSYAYDAAGRQIGSVRYANKVPGFTSAASIANAVSTARTSNSIAALIPPGDAGDILTYKFYNGRGELVGEVDGSGYLTEMVYNANGQIAQMIRYANPANGAATASSTLASLRPASSPNDQASTSTWDALGRLSTQTNPEGTITRYAYNEVGQLTGTTVALNTSEQRTVLSRYDVQGRLVAELSPNGGALLTGTQTQAEIDTIWVQYGTSYTYDAAGRRTSSTVSPDGTTQRTAYFYDDDGRLRYMVDASGRVMANRYDALGHLVSSSALATTLMVGNTGGLLSATANQGVANALAAMESPTFANSTMAYSYDAGGRTLKVTDAELGQTTYTYDAFGDRLSETRTLTAGQTTTTTHTFDHRGLDISDIADVGQIGALTHREYDAFGRLVSAWDANGNKTTMRYDTLGRTVSMTDAVLATRTMTYDAFGRTLTQTDARGATTSYAYDRVARSMTVTTPEGVVITTVHNRHGQTQRIVDGNGNTTTFVHDADGNLLSTTNPLGTTSSSYDSADRLIATVDADGNVVRYTYNASNQVISRVVDPDGLHLQTTYQYDAKGQRILTTDPRGIVTQTSYDKKGEVLTQTVDPGGLNLVTHFAYDLAGRILTVTNPGGTLTRYVYDNLDRRIQSTVDADPLGAPPSGRLALQTNYTYDKAGNLVSKTDATGATTRYVYDADNRLAFTVNAEGDVSRTFYDANGNVVRTIAYASRINPSTWDGVSAPPVVSDAAHDDDMRTVYDADGRATYMLRVTGDGTRLAVVARSFDGNGNVVASVAYASTLPVSTPQTVQDIASAILANNLANPAVDRSTRNTYDAANRLTWSVDGLGDVTRRDYDPNGQLVKMVAYANRVGQGQSASAVVASSADRVTLFAYDAAGRQTSMVDALGSVTSMVYDADGNLVRTIAYASRLPAPTATGLAPAIAILPSSSDRITSAAFDAANRQVYSIDAEGGVTYSDYDANGNVIARIAYAQRINALPVGASASAIALAVQPDAANDRITYYLYDAADRQTHAYDALGYVTVTTYDGVGRVLETALYDVPTGGPEMSGLSANLLGSATAQVNSFTYDAAGNLTSSTDALGHTEHNTYDALGNKLSFTNKAGAVWSYAHDAAGRTVAEHAPSSDAAYSVVTTLMGYDALGNLISRTEAAGTPLARITQYGYDALGRQVSTLFPQVAVYDPASDAINGAAGSTPGTPYGGARVEVSVTPGTQTVYDAFGDAVANLDVVGGISFKAYDKLGRVVYDVDAGGYVTQYGRSTFGDAISLTRYANATSLPTTRSIQNAPDAGAVAQAVSANVEQDRTITTQYDKLGQATQVTQPAVWVFNGDGQSYLASAVTRTTYNAFGQVVRTAVLADQATNTWANTTNYYDRRGDQVASVDALGFLTRQTFDAARNLTGMTQFAQPATVWDLNGYTAPATTAADRNETYTYDLANRKTSQTRVGVTYSADGSINTVVGDLTTTYGYDVLGNQTRTTDALGGITYTYYDALGRTKAVASAARTSTGTPNQTLIPLTVFTRDAMGNVVQKAEYAAGAAWADATGYGITTGAEDRITTTRYDSQGHAVEETDATGQAHHTSYDAAGRVAKTWQTATSSTTDGVALSQALYTVFRYDALGRKTAILTPASTLSLSNGALSEVDQSVAGSKTTTMVWNAFGEMTQRTADSFVDTFDYDIAGRLWRSANQGTHQVMLYDLQGRQTAQISSAGSVGGTSANPGVDIHAFANAQEVDALGDDGLRRADRKLDLLGRVLVQTLPSRQNSMDTASYRPVVYQSFDRWGNVLSQSDMRNAAWVTTFAYDANDKVIQQTQPEIANPTGTGRVIPVTTMAYDALGRQVAVRDANGHTNRQTWDAAGQLLQELHADGGIVTNSYNAFGDKVKVVDAEAHVSLYTFNRMGWNTQVTREGVDVYTSDATGVSQAPVATQFITTYTYDEAGRRLGRFEGPNSTRYTYDARGDTIATTDGNNFVTRRAYDVLGHQVAEKDPNGAIASWGYNADGKLIAHTDIGGAIYSFSYDNAQLLLSQSNTRGQNLVFAYDAAGQLVQINDNSSLNQVTRYVYNAAGKHVLEQTIQGGTTYQSQILGYDELGRLASVDDKIKKLHVINTYDQVGNLFKKNVHYTVTQTAMVDDYGYVQVGVSPRGKPIYEWQKIGSHQQVESTDLTKQLFYAYDAMDRQILADGAINNDANDLSNITADQGHLLGYDKNGNRTTDLSWGTRVTPVYTPDPESSGWMPAEYSSSEGIQTNWYDYDAMDRLSRVATGAFDNNGVALGRDQAITLDTRLYDGAGRVVQSGPRDSLPEDYVTALVGSNTDLSGATTTTSRYDAGGRLLSQHVANEADDSRSYDTVYEGENSVHEQLGYDDAGNLVRYVKKQGDIETTYRIDMETRESYKEGTVNAVSRNTHSASTPTSGSTTSHYDFNGNLVRIDGIVEGDADPHQARSFINDAGGHILRKEQEGNVLDQLVVDGNVVGRYGYGVDPNNPTNSNGDPNYVLQGDFNLAYRPVTNSYPAATTGQYPVQAGDTLQSIALSAYGDSSLWYLIADANSLTDNEDLRVGQVLNIPTRVGAVHNNANTYAPYDPSRVVGSTTPNLPTPAGNAESGGGGGCGGLGQIILIIVAVVVTVYTAGATASALSGSAAFGGSAASTFSTGLSVLSGTANVGAGIAAAAGAVGAAAGSVASQLVGIAIGAQDSFSFSAVALAAISGGISGGLAKVAPLGGGVGAASTTPNVIARAAIANAATQAVSVALGLQDQFSWAGVAAAAIGAGVGSAVSNAVGTTFGPTPVGQFATRAVSGFAAGAATALARGGRVNVTQIATDAFGNALASSLVDTLRQGAVTPATSSSAQGNAMGADNGIRTLDGSRLPEVLMGSSDPLELLGTVELPELEELPQLIELEGGGFRSSTVRAGDFGGSLERVARNQLGPNASQREINNYVGQLAELNSIRNPRAIGGDVQLILPDSLTPVATTGLGVYGRDIALGNQMKAVVQQEPAWNGREVNFGDNRDARDIRATFPSQSNTLASSVPILKSSADDFSAMAIQAYNSGNPTQGDKYLGYASQYYKAADDAQQSANNLSAAAYRFQLPPAAVGEPGSDLAFELKLGGALYAGLGANFELTGNVNLSRPLASGITEFEAGIGVGFGFKAKAGFEPLKDVDPTVAIPINFMNPIGAGQANNTGAISIKASAEGSIPFLTITGLELRGGIQSPLNGIAPTDQNFGVFGQAKFIEPKLSPFINIGANVKIDVFNTSYKRPLPDRP